MKSYPYLLQGKNIIIVIDNAPYTITESNIGYTALKDAIKNEDWNLVPDLVSPKKVLEKYVNGHFGFVNGIMYENGVQVSSALTDRMFSMYEEGFSINPLLALYKNIKLNPSQESAAELYGFLEKNSLPITEDGCFIAYKRVRNDYYDCYSGTMDNSIGNTVEMSRGAVNSNRDITCSTGLHFCSFEYLKSFAGDRIVTVKVNPVDVVSIPSDYMNQKGRCCKYVVIGEVTQEEAYRDSLSEKSVYETLKELVDAIEDESFEELHDDLYQYAVEDDDNIDIWAAKDLSLRDQAQIWNYITGNTLKKFSCYADVERRLYSGSFGNDVICHAARQLGLI